ncbi:MAG: S-layer homology domain-containing protein [Oscillibacter sp.]|nr:S-layer homology domain-containing protein [Oscillibacter sp.]
MKNFKRSIALLLALIMSFSLMATAFAADGEFVPEDDLALTTSFKDVKTTAWYYSDVTECAKLGIVQGFSDGTFKPDDKVTDVQFIVMMTRTFFNTKVESIKAPAGSKWYYANTKAAEETGLSDGLTVKDANMSRYDMALVLYNEIIISGKNSSATSANLEKAKTAVKDYSSMTKKQQTYFRYCYALDILSGMSDGTFSGSNSMTRAQACTVIMRMLKLVNNYNPGDKDNNQYDDGKNQNTGNNNNQSTTGKLANGKDITVANVQAMLEDIKRQYPSNTIWDDKGTNGNWYNSSYNTVAKQILTGVQYNLNCQYACGGWANMVSTTIFGQNGNPGRQVTKNSDLRPGDIIITMNAKTNTLSHVAIVYEINANGFTTSSGNTAGTVQWGGQNRPLETSDAYVYYLAYTRYPN